VADTGRHGARITAAFWMETLSFDASDRIFPQAQPGMKLGQDYA